MTLCVCVFFTRARRSSYTIFLYGWHFYIKDFRLWRIFITKYRYNYLYRASNILPYKSYIFSMEAIVDRKKRSGDFSLLCWMFVGRPRPPSIFLQNRVNFCASPSESFFFAFGDISKSSIASIISRIRICLFWNFINFNKPHQDPLLIDIGLYIH